MKVWFPACVCCLMACPPAPLNRDAGFVYFDAGTFSDAGNDAGNGMPDGGSTPDAGTGVADAGPPPPACVAGPSGLSCLFSMWATVSKTCDPNWVSVFSQSVDARHGDLPAWYQGKALFVTKNAGASIAGTMNDWAPGEINTTQLCGSNLYATEISLGSGRWQYKLVSGPSGNQTWSLDPENFAFAYDNSSDNSDGENNVLNTYDSNLGNLVMPDTQLCSPALNRCSPLTTYLPAGYGDPKNAEKQYPVLFMQDGQNIYDNADCCYGHIGWQVNVTMDSLVASGQVNPAVIVGFNHGGVQRQSEYTGALQSAFMAYQVNTVQPTAAQYWRINLSQAYNAGSSFGGYVSLVLGFSYPSTYRGVASLSGAFFPNDNTSDSINDVIGNVGKIPVGLYLDNGGDPTSGIDSWWDNYNLRTQFMDLGWGLQQPRNCALSQTSLCYYWAPNATHDEFAWGNRAYLFLEYLLGTPGTGTSDGGN